MRNDKEVPLALSILLALSMPLLAQTTATLYYSYNLDGVQVGYAEVTYTFGQGQVYKKKFKFRKIAEDTVEEESSAVLNEDYTLRSAYLSQQSEQRQFWVITVADGVVIQTGQHIIALPQEKFYLEIEDFLKSLAARELSKGTIYKGTILATDWTSLTGVKARYMGKKKIHVNFHTYDAHQFHLNTEELKDFWVTAWIAENGELLGYRLGNFDVFAVPRLHALDIRQNREPLPAPVIFDVCDFQAMLLRIPAAEAEIYPVSPYQEVRDEAIVLKARRAPNPDISGDKIASGKSEYLGDSPLTPISHPLIVRHAPSARKNALTPVATAENIAQWVHRNLTLSQTSAGRELQTAFGMSRDAPALVAASLCRANGIPSRLAAGLVYSPGKFSYESWAEVYLGGWLPLYRGQIAKEARFLKVRSNAIWAETETIPRLSVGIEEVVKAERRLRMDTRSTYISEAEATEDWLLGISWQTPQNWELVPVEIGRDDLLFQSSSGNIMLVKVFEAPRPLDEVLKSLKDRMSEAENLEILWQQARAYPDGNGLELAVKSSASRFVYRAFVADKGNKGVLVLLVVAEQDIPSHEKGFQNLISSLRFLGKE